MTTSPSLGQQVCLCNMRKLRLYLSEYATQLLMQAHLSSWLLQCPTHRAAIVKALQTIQTAAAHLVFEQPIRKRVTPQFISSSGCSHQVPSSDTHLHRWGTHTDTSNLGFSVLLKDSKPGEAENLTTAPVVCEQLLWQLITQPTQQHV